MRSAKLIAWKGPAARLAPGRFPGVTVALCTVLLIPVLAAFWISITTGTPGASGYTGENYKTVVTDAFGLQTIGRTVIMAVTATAISVALGAVLAWAVARTDLPFKQGINVGMGLVLLTPGVVHGIGWGLLFSPTNGIANEWLGALGLPTIDIFTLTGIAVVLGLNVAPGAYLLLFPIFQSMDASLEEAALVSGARRIRTFIRIDLRLAFPALAAAAIYMFVLSFSLFDIPAILGLSHREIVFSTMIFQLMNPSFGLPNYGLAAAYGAIVVIVAAGLTYFYGRVLTTAGKRYATVGGKGVRSTPHRLKRGRPWLIGLAGTYFALALLLPMITVLYSSLLPFFQLPSSEAFDSISLGNYTELAQTVGSEPIKNTLILFAIVPTLAVIIGFGISWIVVRSRLSGRSILASSSFLPFAVPRVILGVSILYLALLINRVVPVYGTLLPLVFADVIFLLAVTTRTLNGSLLQISPDLEEAARVSGASAWRAIRRVTLPLVRPAIFFAAFTVAILTIGEVTMAAILAAPGSQVLPAVILELWTRGRAPEAAAASVTLMTAALVFAVIFRRRMENLGRVTPSTRRRGART